MKSVTKVLVANRGEIALRILRTLKSLGIETAAIYSDVDRGSLFTRFADSAFHLGDNGSQSSYLSGERIVECAIPYILLRVLVAASEIPSLSPRDIEGLTT